MFHRQEMITAHLLFVFVVVGEIGLPLAVRRRFVAGVHGQKMNENRQKYGLLRMQGMIWLSSGQKPFFGRHHIALPYFILNFGRFLIFLRSFFSYGLGFSMVSQVENMARS